MKKYPKLYDLPLWAGVGALGLHTLWLYLYVADRDLLPAYTLPALAWASGLCAMVLMGGAILVFTREQIMPAVYASLAGHIVVVAAHFAHRIDASLGWIQPTAALIVFAALLPYLLKQYANLSDKYKPGGLSGDVWQAWRQDIADFVNAATSTANSAMDAARTSEALARTASGQVADVAGMKAEIAELRAMVAALVAKEDARAKDAARKRAGRGKQSIEA